MQHLSVTDPMAQYPSGLRLRRFTTHLLACQMAVFQDASFQVLSPPTSGFGYLSRVGTSQISVRAYFYGLASTDENYPWVIVDSCTGTLITGLRPWKYSAISGFDGQVTELRRLADSLISTGGGLPRLLPSISRTWLYTKNALMSRYLSDRPPRA